MWVLLLQGLTCLPHVVDMWVLLLLQVLTCGWYTAKGRDGLSQMPLPWHLHDQLQTSRRM